jgi:tetratricopeptide (TPR) repeat protein
MASFDVHKFMALDTTKTQDWDDATSLVLKVENELKENDKIQDQNYRVQVMCQVSNVYRVIMGNAKTALSIAKEASESCRKKGSMFSSSKSIVKPLIEASAIVCVASCKELLGDIKGAEKELRRALKLLPSDARVDRARYRQNLANVIKKKGNLKEAKKLYMDVLEEFQSIFGKDAPNMYIAATLVNLGVCHIQLAEYHDAQKHMHQALEAFQNLHGKDTPHPHIVSVLTSLGNIYEARQKLARARQYREQSLAMTLDLYVSCC